MYLLWHYSRAIKSLFQIWANFVWFLYHFFSLPVLVRTWIAPWRRLDESYGQAGKHDAWWETLIVNTLMRLVGFLMRSMVLIFGSLVLLVWIFLLPVLLLVWLILPPLTLGLFLTGLSLFFE